jgi:ABC-type glycerol-3-phosphate transport system substrate-binding protein
MKENLKTIVCCKKALMCLPVFAMAAALLIGCNRASNGSADARQGDGGSSPVTLQFMSLASGPRFEAEVKSFELLKKKHPNITVESQSVSQVDGFITAIKAKFAAGEAPDFYTYQAGTRVREFAKEGLLTDITDEEFLKRANPQDVSFNSYEGRVYAVPTRVEYAGFFVNHEKLAEYPNIKVPENFDEFKAACEQLVAAGFRYPVLLAGKDIGNVSQIDFQYLATVAIPPNPNYYQELIDGTRKFSDPWIRDLFAKYGEVLKYVSEDSLGVDNDEAIKRFIRGEGVFWIAHGSTIARMREMAGEEFDFRMYPSALQNKGEQRYFLCAQAQALAVPKSTKQLDSVRLAVTEYLSPEACDIAAIEGKDMPALLGSDKLPDKCLEPCREWFDSAYKVPHADLDWVPGIKDIMKEITQKWIMGDDLNRVLNEWETQHRRLLDTNPDFVANFGKS